MNYNEHCCILDGISSAREVMFVSCFRCRSTSRDLVPRDNLDMKTPTHCLSRRGLCGDAGLMMEEVPLPVMIARCESLRPLSLVLEWSVLPL